MNINKGKKNRSWNIILLLVFFTISGLWMLIDSNGSTGFLSFFFGISALVIYMYFTRNINDEVDKYMLIADKELSSGDIVSAVQALKAVLEMDPGNVNALKMMEMIQDVVDEVDDEVDDEVVDEVDKNSSNDTSSVKKSEQLSNADEYQDLASDYMHKVFDRLDDIEDNEELSLELIDYVTQALLCLNKIEELDADSNQDDLRVLAWRVKAQIYLEGMKDYTKATERVVDAIRLDIHDESLYMLMADIEYASGDIVRAIQASKAVLEMDPGNVNALKMLEIIQDTNDEVVDEVDDEIKEYLSNFEFELDAQQWTAALFTTGNIKLAYENCRNKKQVKNWEKIQGILLKDQNPNNRTVKKIRSLM